MLLFNFFGDSVKILKLSQRFLRSEAVTARTEGKLKHGLTVKREVADPAALAEEVQSLLKKSGFKINPNEECAFVVHDERTFTLRLSLSEVRDEKEITELIKKRVKSFIPESPSAQTNAFKLARAGKEGGEVQFIAVDRELFTQYLELFNLLELKPVLAVPESYAIYTLLASQIDREETVLYLNIESEVTDVVVLDKFGVLQTFSEPIGKDRLAGELERILTFLKERWKRSPGRVLLGGEGAASLDLDVEPAPAEASLESFPIPIRVDLGKKDKLGLFSLLGLALLSRQKDPLNLVG